MFIQKKYLNVKREKQFLSICSFHNPNTHFAFVSFFLFFLSFFISIKLLQVFRKLFTVLSNFECSP